MRVADPRDPRAWRHEAKTSTPPATLRAGRASALTCGRGYGGRQPRTVAATRGQAAPGRVAPERVNHPLEREGREGRPQRATTLDERSIVVERERSMRRSIRSIVVRCCRNSRRSRPRRRTLRRRPRSTVLSAVRRAVTGATHRTSRPDGERSDELHWPSHASSADRDCLDWARRSYCRAPSAGCPSPQAGPIEQSRIAAVPGVRVFDDKDGLPRTPSRRRRWTATAASGCGHPGGARGLRRRRVSPRAALKSDAPSGFTALAAPSRRHDCGPGPRRRRVGLDHGAFRTPRSDCRTTAFAPSRGCRLRAAAASSGQEHARGSARSGASGGRVRGPRSLRRKLVTSITPGAAPGDAWVGRDRRRTPRGRRVDDVASRRSGSASRPRGGRSWVAETARTRSRSAREISRASTASAGTRGRCRATTPSRSPRHARTRAMCPPVGRHQLRRPGSHRRRTPDRHRQEDEADLPSDFVVTLSPTRPEQGPPALWAGPTAGAWRAYASAGGAPSRHATRPSTRPSTRSGGPRR